MELRPSVLCPIDFSHASRSALRYATAIAEHFAARLTLLTVNDPSMAGGSDLRHGPNWLPDDRARELRRFYEQTFEHRTPEGIELAFEVAHGKPASEILRVARERGYDIIVMSTHGLTGVRKPFFGATTERVLRETCLPVLVTPAAHTGPLFLEEVKGLVRRVLAPVDLSAATARQLQIARGLAEALDVPLLLLHVVEPVRFPVPAHSHLPDVDSERRSRAAQALDELVATIPSPLRPEGLAVYGAPSEEIARVANERKAGLIVIGLHGSAVAGAGMGSVTYRVLCLSPTLVLALPPSSGASEHQRPGNAAGSTSTIKFA